MRDITKGIVKFLGFFVALAAAGAIILRLTVVDVAVVGHNAMAPTMEAGEQVLIWHGDTFDQGTIAVCQHPGNLNEMVMGRVVGEAGDVVSTFRGQLQINDRTQDTDWRGELQFTDTLNDRTDTMKLGTEKMGNHSHGIFHREQGDFSLRSYEVGEGEVYLLADNRFHVGNDSRAFGAVNTETCMGYVFMRLKPADIPVNDLGHGHLDMLR